MQLGLALHGYHNTFHHFPPGVNSPKRFPALPFLSWNARLLPYLEQQALSDQIRSAYQADPDFRKVPPHVHRKTVVAVFSCPMDPRTSGSSTKMGSLQVAFTSYLGIQGLDLFNTDGILYMDSTVRIAEVSDGTSNTLLVGERPPSADERYGWWYAGWGQAEDGSCEMIMGVRERNVAEPLCVRGPYQYGIGRIDNQCDMFHFWSLHDGGAHFLFADGSVRFLSYGVAPLMPALASRAGGETVSSFD
jgi:prepilin-type processing-associated H-X9-DG protein